MTDRSNDHPRISGIGHHAEIITITGRSYRLRNRGRQDGQANGDQAAPKEEKRPRKGPPQAPAGE